MLEKHADKGEEPCDVFSWCVRDIIAKASGLPKDDTSSFREKVAYFNYMHHNTDFIEMNGKKYGEGAN